MTNNNKPWDARIAYRLICILRDTFVTPNHLTGLRLFCGLSAGVFLSLGDYIYSNIGACLFVLSNFLDHADGELARLTGKISNNGHYFDLVSDALVNIFLFLGIGLGLMNSELGLYAGMMGLIAGIAVATIFYLRHKIEKQRGKMKARQPNKGGFEIEDLLYFLPLITFLQLEHYFLILAAAGAPGFCLWVAKDYLEQQKYTI